MELIVHPGHAKCGSSALQRVLYRHRAAIARQGFGLPDREFRLCRDTPNGGDDATDLPIEIFETLRISEDLSWFRRSLDGLLADLHVHGIRGLILSAENMTNGLHLPLVQEAQRLLASRFDRVRVVYYIRRQDEVIWSSWQQWSHKEGIPFSAFKDRMVEARFPSFFDIAQRLEGIYGKGTVVVRPLVSSALIGGQLIGDFAARAGLVLPETAVEEDHANRALSEVLCDVLSRVPSVYRDVHDVGIKALLTDLSGDAQLISRRRNTHLTTRVRSGIMESFRPSNLQLTQKYFPDVAFEDVFGVDTLPEDDELARLSEEVEGLKDVVAILVRAILQQVEH